MDWKFGEVAMPDGCRQGFTCKEALQKINSCALTVQFSCVFFHFALLISKANKAGKGQQGLISSLGCHLYLLSSFHCL